MFQPLLGWLEVLVAITVLVAAVKTVYSGWVHRRVIVPLDRIAEIGKEVEEIRHRQGDMYDRQQRQIDAVIALGRSHRSDEEFDEESFREDVRGGEERPDDYLADD